MSCFHQPCVLYVFLMCEPSDQQSALIVTLGQIAPQYVYRTTTHRVLQSC